MLQKAVDKWLAGFDPPARCSACVAGEERCLQSVAPGRTYCAFIHDCQSRTCCSNIRVSPVGPYCTEHICLKTEKNGVLCCPKERIANSGHCLSHSCILCVLYESPTVGPANPTVCESHMCALRSKEGRICRSPVLHPQRYCLTHCCRFCAQSGYEPHSQRMSPETLCCSFHKCSVPSCPSVRLNTMAEACSEHLCRLCLPDSYVVVDSKCLASGLCAAHRCSHPEVVCANEKDPVSPDYCRAHTCRVCIDLKIFPVLGVVLDEAPRNHCADHPLCARVLKNGLLCHMVAGEGLSLIHI